MGVGVNNRQQKINVMRSSEKPSLLAIGYPPRFQVCANDCLDALALQVDQSFQVLEVECLRLVSLIERRVQSARDLINVSAHCRQLSGRFTKRLQFVVG